MFLTVKFGWDVEMGRLNLDVKFMVLIISVSVLFVKIVACFFLLFCLASLLQGSYCCGSTLGQWRNFTQTQYNYVVEFHSAKCFMFLPSHFGFEADSEKDCNAMLFCTVSQWIPNLFFVVCCFSHVFFGSDSACIYASVPHTTACSNKISFSLTSGAEVVYHHGLKAVTNKTWVNTSLMSSVK